MPYRTAEFRPNAGVTCPCGEPARELCETCATWTCGGGMCLFRSEPTRCSACAGREYLSAWLAEWKRHLNELERRAQLMTGCIVAIGLWVAFLRLLGVL